MSAVSAYHFPGPHPERTYLAWWSRADGSEYVELTFKHAGPGACNVGLKLFKRQFGMVPTCIERADFEQQ